MHPGDSGDCPSNFTKTEDTDTGIDCCVPSDLGVLGTDLKCGSIDGTIGYCPPNYFLLDQEGISCCVKAKGVVESG